MNKLKFKAIISSLLLIAFLIVVVTGVGLWLATSGRIARLENWTFLGLLDRHRLETMHTRFGFGMVGIILIHLALNFKMFISELKVLFGINKK
jgi:hypothetical protein